MNITREDCIGLSGVDEAEVAAIAEHEHIDDMAAAALAQQLLQQPHGANRLRDMIVDDIRAARQRHDLRHAKELVRALRHFIGEHQAELMTIAQRSR
jgi:aryl-alcohol dehydrogenase-like predicted oxidoreductase